MELRTLHSLAMCGAPPLDVDRGGGGLAGGVAHGTAPREEQLQRERRRGLGLGLGLGLGWGQGWRWGSG